MRNKAVEQRRFSNLVKVQGNRKFIYLTLLFKFRIDAVVFHPHILHGTPALFD